MWNGEDLNGRRLLLHREQGLGDAIQFIRYVPLLAERGAKVIVHCDRSLHRLFSHGLPIEQLVADHDPLPDFDFHLPLMSLPRLFATTIETIPNQVPYLMPTSDLIEQWSQRLAVSSAELKIGMVWSGSVHFPGNHERAMTLSKLEPLLELRGFRFYSLQKGPPSSQLSSLPARLSITDLGGEFADYADTAAAIMNLDLLLTVDTSVAHMGGALGRPTWVMLSRLPDWRWLRERSDSPWYPTMRLFRQQRLNDWPSLVSEVATEIQNLLPRQ